MTGSSYGTRHSAKNVRKVFSRRADLQFVSNLWPTGFARLATWYTFLYKENTANNRTKYLLIITSEAENLLKERTKYSLQERILFCNVLLRLFRLIATYSPLFRKHDKPSAKVYCTCSVPLA